MAPSSLRRLILTVSLAALVTLTAAAPVPATTLDPTDAPTTSSDPCTVLGSKTTGATYDEVAACYQYIPYNTAVAASTLKTVRTLFDDFYIFRDSALTPGLEAPFSSPPVDIVDVLNKIETTTYPNDYSFHTAVMNAIASLHDAHAAYNGNVVSSLSPVPEGVSYAIVDGQNA